jgi:hypothetical protein
MNDKNARKGDNDANISPPRVRPFARENSDLVFQRSTAGEQDNHKHLNNGGNNEESAKSTAAAPYRYYPHSTSSSDAYSPPRSTAATSHVSSLPRSTANSSPLRFNRHADYLEPPPKINHGRRPLTDDYADSNDGRPEKPRHASVAPAIGRQSLASSTASTVKVSSGRLAGEQANSMVFRKDAPEHNKDNSKLLPPPVMEVTVSQDEDDDGLYDPAALPNPPEHTNIFISPHYVPQMSPHKVNGMASISDNGETTPSSRATTTSSYSGMPVSSSPRTHNSIFNTKSYSYDAEESCLLTDVAAGAHANASSLPGNYDALSSLPASNSPSRDNANDQNARKIMVVRPYRSNPDESIASPTSVLSSPKSPWKHDPDDKVDAGTATASSLYSSELEYSSKTSSYSRDVKLSDRRETLSRARALLEANRQYMDSPQVQLAGTPPYMSNTHSPDRVKQRLFKQRNSNDVTNLNEDLEDGLAPLGSTDATVESPSKRRFTPSMLSSHPSEHMQEIYEEGSRRLKVRTMGDGRGNKKFGSC